MGRAGLRPREILRPKEIPADQAMAGPFAWLEQPERPTGIIFHHAGGLGPFLHQCGRLGLSVPRDISVLSISDGEAPGEGFPIDYVEIPHTDMGRATAAMVLRKIGQPDAPLPPHLLPPRLHTRGSSAAPPTRS